MLISESSETYSPLHFSDLQILCLQGFNGVWIQMFWQVDLKVSEAVLFRKSTRSETIYFSREDNKIKMQILVWRDLLRIPGCLNITKVQSIHHE